MAGYLTAREVAERFSVHIKTIFRWARRRRKPLPAYRFGRDYRFKLRDVEQWEEGLRVVNREETD